MTDRTRGAARRRSTRRPRAASVVAALVALMLAVPPLAAHAESPTPSPTASAAPGVVELVLSPINAGVKTSESALTMSVTLVNGTDAATPETPVDVRIGTQPLVSRDEVTQWLDETASPDLAPLGSAVLGPAEPGAMTTTTVQLGSDDPLVTALAPGVYPISASARGGELTADSVVVVAGADAAPAPVTVVVPITAAPRSDGVFSAAELIELTGSGGALDEALTGVTGTAAVLAIDPAILTSIRVLGTSAPAAATEWLADLEALPNERFALQFGDADVSPQIGGGLAAPLQPTAFTANMAAADFIPAHTTETPEGTATEASTPAPTATPSPTSMPVDPRAPVYPTVDELTDVSATRSRVYWPTPGSADTSVVTALGAVKDDVAGTVLVPATTLTGSGSAHATVDGAEVLAYDTDVSAALLRASSIDDSVLRGTDLAAASAYLSFAISDAAGEPVMITVDRKASRSSTALRAAITMVQRTPGTTTWGLDGLLAAPARTAAVGEVSADSARTAATSLLLSDEEQIARFATVLDDTTLLTGPERASILQLLSVGWTDADLDWGAAVTAHREASVKTLNSVGLRPSSTINLLGSGASLRFWVHNDLPYPVNLVLYATPDSFRLDVQGQNSIVATASSNTRVEVPVQARVGNGQVTLTMQLRSRAAVAIGEPQEVTVNVRAEWEGVGLVALGIVVGVLLILGVVRTVLKLRGRRKERE